MLFRTFRYRTAAHLRFMEAAAAQLDVSLTRPDIAEAEVFLLGLVLAAVPFVFGALRAATSGSDFRYLALAIGTCVDAFTVLRAAKATGGPTLMRIVIAFALAAGVGVALGLAQGATSAPATLVVAGGFALCEAVGLGIALRARAG